MRIRPVSRFSILASSIAALVGTYSPAAEAATYSWAFNGTANWNTNNWGAPSAPLFPNAAGDIAQFTTGAFSPTTNVNVNITIGQLSGAVAGRLWTIGATGGTLTLDNTGGVNNVFGNANAAISATGGATDGNVIQVNAPIVIANTNLDIGTTNGGMAIGAGGISAATNQTLTFRNNGTSATRNILVNGSIGTSGAGTIAIQNLGNLAGNIASGSSPAAVVLAGVIGNRVTGISHNSPGSLVLNNPGNTFTGPISVTGGGMLSVTRDGALGNTANDILLDNATLANFNVVNTNTNFADPSGNLLKLGAGRTITLGAGGGAIRLGFNRTMEVAGVIDGAGSFSKLDNGTLVLSGLNTYTAATAIKAGMVSVANIGNTGNSGNLGTNGTIHLGDGGTNGVLNYTGTGETTDRVLNWAGTTGGGNVNANGTGLLRFTSNTTTTGSGEKGLSFSGSGNGQLDGTISNNGGLINLNKNGTGVWTLNGNLTLGGGNINVNSGTLNLGGANATSGTGAYVINGAGRLLIASSSTGNAPITVNGGGIVGGAGSTTGLMTAAANAAIQLNTANPTSALTVNGVTFSGTTTISFDGTPVNGTYTVLNYGAGAVTGIANLVGARGGIVDNGIGQISATVQTASRTWAGASGNWDNGTSTAWTEGDQKFFAGDTVTFNEPAAANTVTLSGPLSPAAVTVNNATNAYTFSGTGAIVGASSLTKAGPGTLTVSTANNFYGGTSIAGGTLVVGNATALGTGPVAASNGATLSISGAYNIANSVSVTGGATLNSTAAGNASASVVNLSGPITGVGNWTIAANGDTSDTGGGVAGHTLLTGANTFTGNVTITSGVVDNGSSFGDPTNMIILNGGGLVDRNNSIEFARNIQVGSNGGILRSFGSATTTFSGSIANAPGVGTATLKHTDGGTQRLAGDGSGFTGTFTNARGNLEITANNANWPNTDFILNSAGGTMTVNGGGTASVKSIAMTKDVFVNNSTRLNVSAVNWTTNSWIQTGTAATPGSLTSSTGTLTVNVTEGTDHQIRLQIQNFDASTPVSFVKNGANDVNLTVTNTYTGGTTVNQGVLNLTGGGGANGTIRGVATVNAGGTLRLSTGDATGYDANTRLSVINLNGGTLNVNSASNQTLGNAVINITGGAITGIANSNLDFFQGNSGLNSLASANTSTISGVALSMLRQGNTTVSVEDGTAPIDLQINSVIRTSPSGDPVGAVLKKTGAGTLELTANNTFARELEIAAGTLLVNNVASLVTDSGTGAGPVDVLTGAVLGGTGTIAPGGTDGITIAGIVAPGASIGNLTFNLSSTTGIVSLTGGSFQFELGMGGVDINNTGTGDLLTISGASAGDVVFSNNLIDFGGSGTAGWFKLFDTSLDATTWTGLTVDAGNVITGGLSIANLPAGFTGDLVLGDGINGSAGDIYANVVPEPGTSISLMGGLGVLMGRRRRRA